ncbi:MAG: DNA primase [Gammaproteobacteria bacterium]|nr:DNA primase [Gammaproteobacteria bacterium]MDJ0872656.1 DNA primase [Gammaproteobacteria bacterium]
MAGRIPQQFIDDLLARVDIVDVVDERVPLKRAGRDYTARCPFHDEKTPSFTVSQEKQFYHCFGCGAHGSAVGFLMDYAHLSFVEAIGELASRAGLQVPVGEGEAQLGAERHELYEILSEAAKFYRAQLREHPDAGRAVAYLKARGLSGQIAAAFGVGYAPPGWDRLLQHLGNGPGRIEALERAGLLVQKDAGRRYDRFRDRIMFPILDRQGRTIGFGGRVVGDGKPKYLNSPETPVFHKGKEVYGLFQVRQARSSPAQLLVVEGYMDVVALAQFGIEGAVATLGTAITPDHLQQLFRATAKLVFCFDGDAAGQRAAWRALEATLPLMSEGRQAAFMFLPEGQDPDSAIRLGGGEAFASLLGAAQPLSRFFFDHLAAQVELRSLDGRARLVELCKPLLARLPRGAFKQLMTARLAELSGMAPALLSGLLEGGTSRVSREERLLPTTAQAPSLVRKTITLLLHAPGLAQTVDDHRAFAELELAGADVLTQLLELLHAKPELSMAGIVEHFRETDIGRHLRKLAVAEDPIAFGGDREREFRDAIRKLQSKIKEQRLGQLQAKASTASLSEDEKREFAGLLRDSGPTKGQEP